MKEGDYLFIIVAALFIFTALLPEAIKGRNGRMLERNVNTITENK